MSKQRKFVLISALVGVIATFLPWWSFSTFGYGYSINGFHGLGILAFICFVAAGIMAYIDNQTTTLDKTKWMATLIAGGIAALIIIYYIISTSSVYNTLSYGIYLAALAALGILLSAFLFKSPTDNIRGGFDSLRNDISTRMKSDTHTNTGTTNSGYTNPDTNRPTNTGTTNTGYTNPDTNRPTNTGTSNTGYTNPDTNRPTNTGTTNTGYTNTPDTDRSLNPNDPRRDTDERNDPPSNPPM